MIKIKHIKVNGVDLVIGDDGRVIREPHGSMAKVGMSFGSIESKGYCRVQVNGQSKKVHRLVAKAFILEYTEDLHIDHINGVHDDNRLENLRLANFSTNARGFRKVRDDAKVKYRGVTQRKEGSRFRAAICTRGILRDLGLYATALDAALAYDEAAIEFGFLPEALNRFMFLEVKEAYDSGKTPDVGKSSVGKYQKNYLTTN